MSAPKLLLIGSPNSGKTLLFNRLTHSHGSVANYPGVTVEVLKGYLHASADLTVQLVDLPGIYSLKGLSEDEQVTLKALKEAQQDPHHTWVAFVVPAAHLERGLYTLFQLLEHGFKPLLILTLMDEAQSQGVRIDKEALAKRLGLVVVAVSALRREGFLELKEAILEVSKQGTFQSPSAHLLAQPAQAIYEQIDALLKDIYEPTFKNHKKIRWLDGILLHPIWGFVVFFIVLWLFLLGLFKLSEPAVAFIENLVSFSRSYAQSHIPHAQFRSLIGDGILMGVGNVLAFVPLVGILFFFLGLLEDSGYLARVAFLLDKPLSALGLCGRSFVPLLSGFACAVPAIVATRTIPSFKSRILTILVMPLMACSARLPVYGLLISAFFKSGPLILFIFYALGIGVAFLAAFVFQHTLLKNHPKPQLIMELPPYRFPHLSSILSQVWRRVSLFLKEAGTTLLAMSIVIWALLAFPQTSSSAQIQLENSYAGRLGKTIEPLIKPLGFDWQIGIGIVASFAAREVFVSTLGVMSGLSEEVDENSPTLRKTLQKRYTPLTALSLMTFFALAMQCLSTLVVTYQETKSLFWPFLQFSYMTFLAYVASFLVYQVGSWWLGGVF